MDTYRIALLLHIFGASTWFGAHVLHLAIVSFMVRQQDVGVIRPLAERLHGLSGVIFGPSALVTLIAGLWMIHDGPSRFGDIWIDFGLALLIAAMAMGGLRDGPCGQATIAACDEGDLEGAQTAARKWRTTAQIMTLMLGVAICMMVFRPA